MSATAELAPSRGAAVSRRLAQVADTLERNVPPVLGFLVGLQLLLAVTLFFSVAHNGWLTYQGGDQLWLMTTSWLLGQGTLPTALVSYGWPVLVMPLTWLTGPSSLDLLPLTTVLQVGVLGPIGTLAAYDIGARLAGRVAGLWCAVACVVAPYAVTPLFADRYEERWTDQVLVQATGFTQLADYPSTIVLLVAAALTLRSLDGAGLPTALLAGTLTGLALGIKPANAVFLAGPALGYLLARRGREALVFAAALVPAVVTLALWKQRGLGHLPLFGQEELRQVVGTALPVAESYLDRLGLSLDDWGRNMSNLREFFWSARLAQWAPLAGALAVARLSLPAAGLLGGWLLGYFVVKGSGEVAGIENGSFWRLVMPALPAYVILCAALPLLVPGLVHRLGARLRPVRNRPRVSWTTSGSIAAVLAVVPLATIAVATPQRGVSEALVLNEILIPVAGEVASLDVERAPGGNRLTWTDTTSKATPFYRVYRVDDPATGLDCRRGGADRCELRATELATTRAGTYLDPDAPPGALYRVGVAANWLDDPAQGDVMLVSPEARATR